MPQYIGFVLHALGILLGYGRHLLATVQRRADAPTFTTIAACFGTANLSIILAHLNRGILRAAALERMLLERAATGRDIEHLPRTRADDTPPDSLDAPAERSAARNPTPHASRRAGPNDPKPFMPTPEELDRQVRRRPIGSTIADICLDLAVMPGLCTAPFWNQLFGIMHYFGGGGGVITVMREKQRREQAFIQEQDRTLGSNWDWLRQTRDTVRQILGFFIGEEPVDPFAQPPEPSVTAAALATGPP